LYRRRAGDGLTEAPVTPMYAGHRILTARQPAGMQAASTVPPPSHIISPANGRISSSTSDPSSLTTISIDNTATMTATSSSTNDTKSISGDNQSVIEKSTRPGGGGMEPAPGMKLAGQRVSGWGSAQRRVQLQHSAQYALARRYDHAVEREQHRHRQLRLQAEQRRLANGHAIVGGRPGWRAAMKAVRQDIHEWQQHVVDHSLACGVAAETTPNDTTTPTSTSTTSNGGITSRSSNNGSSTTRSIVPVAAGTIIARDPLAIGHSAVAGATQSSSTPSYAALTHHLRTLPGERDEQRKKELREAKQRGIFPKWLFDRGDFQKTYHLTATENCLRILDTYPDERIDLHIKALRRWIKRKPTTKATSTTATGGSNNSGSTTMATTMAGNATLPPDAGHARPIAYLASLPSALLNSLLRVLKYV
jgi:hypothetical protein